MKEAGEIIEMLDSNEIQDLQFKTYAFDNSPNGKMMLGILFATSKQYSDKLSVDVIRGIKGNTQDGKYNGVIKKDYFADSQSGLFMPDAHNWQLLRRAVIMRLKERKTNQAIADYLNSKSLSKLIHESYKITDWISDDYSKHCDLFYCKYVPGIFSGEREIFICKNGHEIIAVTFLKKDSSERKISTLYVKPDYQGKGIASKLLEMSFEWLETTKPLITIADYKLPQFTSIIQKYN